MMKRVTAISLALFMGLLGAVGGFAFGQRQGLSTGLGLLGLQTSANLSLGVETASRIRVGDTEGALALLDEDIDAAVVNSSTSEPRYQPSALAMAKVYRSVIPARGWNAKQVEESLTNVQAPPPGALMLCARSGKPCESASGLLELRRRKESPTGPR